jgi:hypothetical protein
MAEAKWKLKQSHPQITQITQIRTFKFLTVFCYLCNLRNLWMIFFPLVFAMPQITFLFTIHELGLGA